MRTTAVSFHISVSGLLWSLISLAWIILSGWALTIFHKGLMNAHIVPDARRKEYAIHAARDGWFDEWWRMAQHIASLLVGVASFFVSPIPPHFVPHDAQEFDGVVIVVLFFLNFASGVNTIRAVSDWRWRERFVGVRSHDKGDPVLRKAIAQLKMQVRALTRQQRDTDRVAGEMTETVDDHEERIETVEDVVEVKHTVIKRRLEPDE